MGMCAAANAFATKDTQQATAAVHTIYVTDCPAIAADTAYPVNWYNYYHQQGMMVVYQQAYKNVSANFAQITQWADGMAAQFDTPTGPNWFNIGNYAAMIAKTALPQVATLDEPELFLQ